MNTQTKPELFAPCFPFAIDKKSIEVEHDVVTFSFTFGMYSIDCEIKGEQLTDMAYLEPQSNPQNGYEVEYTKFEVDSRTLAVVTRSDFEETKMSVEFILTESQVYELNEWLEADAVEKFEMAQG
ncbi:hypothetical protein BEN71_10420 [Acinetobacter wuhouensis]|uniref:hypothetical protein n=1 Tax=Acinetobacter wuhouensis TaxID=1879050 RepID=UPI000E334283|nr:hypothetical protein [Acinetobacter wuhouensis]AXQ21803.1 hypothetical protein BEN71_06870 [Acinetobacter wuhouensis]AXQ22461.1 hypothetical protein BEN71_10420 [Acinetobacter wuhouensis]